MKKLTLSLVLALSVSAGTLAFAFEAPPTPGHGPQRSTTSVQAYPGYPYNSHYVTLKSGLRVHYLDEGEGEIPLLLIHGMPTQAYLWRYMIPELAAQNRVIAIDLPNWGKSDKTPDVRGGVPCAGEYANWIEEFVDAIGVDKVRIVVHDMGFVGFLYAARNQAEVDGIVLFETAIGPFPRDQAPPFLEAFLGAEGESLLVDQNYMVETLLLNNAYNNAGAPPFRTMNSMISEADAEIYKAPFTAIDDRRAMLFDRECLGFVGAYEKDPGTKARKDKNLAEFTEFARYLSTTDTPRLVLFGSPGFVLPRQPVEAIVTGAAPAEMGGWRNTGTVTTKVITAPTLHFWQEEQNGAAKETAKAIQTWIDQTF